MSEDIAEITMELTPYMEGLVKENFDCEIEMMQGSVTKLKDGRTRYEFSMNADKAEPIKQFIMQVIINSHPTIYN